MTRMRLINRILVTVAVAAASASCGDVVRTGRAPVLLVIDSLEGARGKASGLVFESNLVSDVITNVTTPAPCTTDAPCPTVFSDPGQVKLRVIPKDIGTAAAPTTPSTNNDVTITRVHIAYRRTDGRNVPGVDVPRAFDGATTGTVSTTQTTLGFLLVRNDAKIESPLIQLKTNGIILTTIADVTFYGRDQVGNDISVTGSIQIDFGNFGDQ
jgi:hypothetical protein